MREIPKKIRATIGSTFPALLKSPEGVMKIIVNASDIAIHATKRSNSSRREIRSSITYRIN